MSIQHNLEMILGQLAQSGHAKLIAVSKTRTAGEIREAYFAGQRDFGENKVQELCEKAFELSDLTDLRWHFIGHLQSNKINQLLTVEQLVSIHSIDSIKLLNKLLTKPSANKIGIFLQVNTSGEDEKFGFESMDEIQWALEKLQKSKGFYVQGLMTIGRIRTESFEDDARDCFSKLLKLKSDLEKKTQMNLQLSMGMSADFNLANQMGSDWVRIGTAIFGAR